MKKSVQTDDLNIASSTPLIPPAALKESFSLTEKAADFVRQSRETVKSILNGEDPRLLVVVGPCSIHDPDAAKEYAERIKELQKEVEEALYLVMRVYFEKPRTSLGWRGLILDPHLDGSYDILLGLKTARKLLIDLIEKGIPAGSEVLDPIVPQYIGDLISWVAIGARTTESQTHREIASGLSAAVGFKNSTDGSLFNAINGMRSAAEPRSFIGIDQQGQTSVLSTSGNKSAHLILRGGTQGPNFALGTLNEARENLREASLNEAIIIDCSHANSAKLHSNQEIVLRSVCKNRQSGLNFVKGVMLESNIHEGNQPIPSKKEYLRYGVSITDACIGWEETARLLRETKKLIIN